MQIRKKIPMAENTESCWLVFLVTSSFSGFGTITVVLVTLGTFKVVFPVF
jgi:hypothetical protein